MWWYDNEGAIQSYGIDLFEDLPHFLVLLLCFDRFTPKDWGIVSEFEAAGKDAVLSFPPFPSTLKVSIDQTNKIRGRNRIIGRTTQILHATSESMDPRGGGKSLRDMDLVVKVYWPEESRTGEEEIINKAREIAQQSEDVKGHIPDLIYSHDFVDYSTKEIRKAFGIEATDESKSKSHRVLRIMLFRRLYPITDLTDDKFWTAFWQCFRCKCTPTTRCHTLTLLR